jgi:hypothetical protein
LHSNNSGYNEYDMTHLLSHNKSYKHAA